jgi:hypothetical protein
MSHGLRIWPRLLFAALFAFAFFALYEKSSAATFTCSAEAQNPEQGACYNVLGEGTPAGDFRTAADWQAAFPGWSQLSVTAGFTASQFAVPNQALNPQSAGNIEAVLEGADWFAGLDLTLVGQVDSIGDTSSYSTTMMAQLFYLHFGGGGMAFLFDTPISLFEISGAGSGLSNLRAFNIAPVPVPAALPLFGAALFGMGLWSRRRRRHCEAPAG